MSCGLPVVAFDCPYGPADIITDGTDGFLVKAGEKKCYKDKVCYLLDNVTLRQKMGRAGQQSSQRFDASKVMPIWKNMFEQIMKR
jgi:glycosyltransferase involved in cell wall biosynthesis